MAGLSKISAAIGLINRIWDGVKTVLGLVEKKQIENMKEENREAVEEARNGDQRKIERDVFKSPTAGQPSGLPGTELRDDIPDRLSDPRGD